MPDQMWQQETKINMDIIWNVPFLPIDASAPDTLGPQLVDAFEAKGAVGK